VRMSIFSFKLTANCISYMFNWKRFKPHVFSFGIGFYFYNKKKVFNILS